MSSSPGDYYRRLRLPNNASRREIKAAFRRLARQCHPDLHPNRPDAVHKFQALREAYEVLIDRVQRQRYDQHQQGYHSYTPSTAPQTPSDFYLRGVRYTLARRYRAALDDYNQAIELDDQFAEAFLRRAEVRYLLEDDTGVLNDCQQAIALNSVEAKTYYYQGLARCRLNYVQSAIAAFTDAITCDPEDARCHYQRGLAYQDLGELDNAAKDLRRAAQLFREQGDVAAYQRLQRYLKPFGAAGRSRSMQFLSHLASRFSLSTNNGHPSASSKPNISHPVPAEQPDKRPDKRPNERPDKQPNERSDKPQNKPQNKRSEGWTDGRTDRQIERRASQWRHHNRPARPSERRIHQRIAKAKRLSRRPSGFGNSLRLLSNPAGELVPLYRQLSPRQITYVGYGLAVLANVCFVTGGMQYLSTDSWLLVASWLWAAGGLAFVTMVLVVLLARFWLQISGAWAADIFVLGTALWPLGLLSMAIAFMPSLDTWLGPILILLATLWAFSHSLIVIYSGFSRIQAFPERWVAWFAPVILALGIAAGVGMW
ncbi:MAG: DnaJ domain-containing protein, partial [Phormidesmis sp.]